MAVFCCTPIFKKVMRSIFGCCRCAEFKNLFAYCMVHPPTWRDSSHLTAVGWHIPPTNLANGKFTLLPFRGQETHIKSPPKAGSNHDGAQTGKSCSSSHATAN